MAVAAADDRQLTNIVLMGMGEPLYNYENVAAAMKIVMDPEGLAVSRRKITLSTAGRSGRADDQARVGAEFLRGQPRGCQLHARQNRRRAAPGPAGFAAQQEIIPIW